MGKACRLCGTQIEPWANYCNSCAFKKGICARCGRKVQDTKNAHMYDKWRVACNKLKYYFKRAVLLIPRRREAACDPREESHTFTVAFSAKRKL